MIHEIDLEMKSKCTYRRSLKKVLKIQRLTSSRNFLFSLPKKQKYVSEKIWKLGSQCFLPKMNHRKLKKYHFWQPIWVYHSCLRPFVLRTEHAKNFWNVIVIVVDFVITLPFNTIEGKVIKKLTTMTMTFQKFLTKPLL